MATKDLLQLTDDAIKAIAKKHLDLPHLTTTKSGADFREQAVWQIKLALQEAFAAGYNLGAESKD